MGRPGRYTLSVMAWVAAYAGWSSVIGLVVAAVTGDRPRSVSTGVSALLTVIGPLVPTVVALWFNDWARDGFPSREQQRAAAAANAEAATEEPAAQPDAEAAPAAAPGAKVNPGPPQPPVRPAEWDPWSAQPGGGAAVAPEPEPDPEPPTVPAHPLGVPAATTAQGAPQGAFPVAPLLRDRD